MPRLPPHRHCRPDGEAAVAAHERHLHQQRAPHQAEAEATCQPGRQFRIGHRVVRIEFAIKPHDMRQHGLPLEFLDPRVHRVRELHHGGRVLDLRLALVEDARPAHAQLDGGHGLVERLRPAQIKRPGAGGEPGRQQDRQPLLAHDLEQAQRIQRVERPRIGLLVPIVGRRQGLSGMVERRGGGRRNGRRRLALEKMRDVHGPVLSGKAPCLAEVLDANPWARPWPAPVEGVARAGISHAPGSAANSATQV